MNNPFDFTGQVALVTGAARGIGKAIALALSEQGAEVHAFDWMYEAEEVSGLPIIFHRVDIADSKAVEAGLAEMPKPPSLLVNNAGITRDRSLAKMSDEEWSQVLSVNLTGAFNMLRAVTPLMSGNGYGRVVNVTSINGMRGKFGQANYAASKAGLIGLTKTVAREVGRKGVTVNAIAPGMVMTDMAKKLPQEILDKALNEGVVSRLSTPEDIANGVLFLLSDAAAMITGEVVRVDGGQYI